MKRGFGLIELLIYAAIAAVVAAAAWAAWTDFRHWAGAPDVEKQRLADQKFVDAANERAGAAQTAAAEAERRASNAQADTAACVKTTQEQTDAVKRWKAEADRRGTEVARAKAASAAAARGTAEAVARLQEIAKRPPVKDQTCEQKLQATDKLLRDAARARLKDGK